MSAALTGTSQAQSKFMTSSMSSGQFSGDVTNPTGSGSATVSGAATVDSSGWNSTFDITYDHWTDARSKITIDGALHESASFQSLSPLVGTARLSGMLHATGAVTADVDFDLTLTYTKTSYDITGSVGGNSVHASASVSAQ